MRLKHLKEWEAREQPKKEVNLGLQYKCDVCLESFGKKHDLENHRWRKHTKEERFEAKKKITTHKCSHCQRGHHT